MPTKKGPCAKQKKRNAPSQDPLDKCTLKSYMLVVVVVDFLPHGVVRIHDPGVLSTTTRAR